MKVKQLIESLEAFNPDAEVDAVANNLMNYQTSRLLRAETASATFARNVHQAATVDRRMRLIAAPLAGVRPGWWWRLKRLRLFFLLTWPPLARPPRHGRPLTPATAWQISGSVWRSPRRT